ncbi:MAG: DUF3348 family protein [Ketobacteraceae bacterium]|nr:DUF3348 family protein [Ketobacteraceae bacterium]
MNQAVSSASLGSSRLIRFIAELSVCQTELTHKQFAERLGSLIDFSDSIILSAAHLNLPTMAFEPSQESTRNVNEEFLRIRTTLVQNIIKSTTPGAEPGRIRLPSPALGASREDLLNFEHYHRFYALHQREMDMKIERLRQQVREEIASISPGLAQLSVLDGAISDTLLVHTRRFLGVVPRLLEQRFRFLRPEQAPGQETLDLEDDPESWLRPGGWLARVYRDIQGLLLAELDVRVQPVMGLIEALNKEVETHL